MRIHFALYLSHHTPILTTRQGIKLLAQYGLNGETADVRRAALRCVANALLLDTNMRQAFVDTGYGGKLAERLKVLEYYTCSGISKL